MEEGSVEKQRTHAVEGYLLSKIKQAALNHGQDG